MIGGRPCCEGQDRAEEYGIGGTCDQGGMSRGEAAQSLTQPPECSRPGQGSHDCRSDQAGEQEPDAQGELDQGEPQVSDAGCAAMRRTKKSMGPATQGGWPCPAGANTCRAKPAVNMNGCN